MFAGRPQEFGCLFAFSFAKFLDHPLSEVFLVRDFYLGHLESWSTTLGSEPVSDEALVF
jgi:hypothetical protein